MVRTLLRQPRAVQLVLFSQLIPLAVLPLASYSAQSQEWWLPAFLGVLTVIGLVQVLGRRSHAAWPWYLLGFSQGFNIISRLMMLLPRVTVMVGGVEHFNTQAVVVFVTTMAYSAFQVWYGEQPEVRTALAR